MPFLDVTLPRVSDDTKRALIASLTDAAERAGFDREIFRVSLFEYSAGAAGTGGVPWQDGPTVPPLHMVLYTPPLPLRMKRAAIMEFSQAFAETVQHPEWLPVIHILDHSYDNLGLEGKLSWELIPELKGRKFYNDLPPD